MFYNCYELGNETNIDISQTGSWDYTYCANLTETFRYCSRLGREANFIMNGCNLVNLLTTDDTDNDLRPDNHALYLMFQNAFGYFNYYGSDSIMGDYTVDNMNNGNVELKNWNLQTYSSGSGLNMKQIFLDFILISY